MSSMQEDIQCAGSDTRPPMLDRTDFESWQQRIRLYCLGKDNEENIMKSIKEGPFQMGTGIPKEHLLTSQSTILTQRHLGKREDESGRFLSNKGGQESQLYDELLNTFVKSKEKPFKILRRESLVQDVREDTLRNSRKKQDHFQRNNARRNGIAGNRFRLLPGQDATNASPESGAVLIKNSQLFLAGEQLMRVPHHHRPSHDKSHIGDLFYDEAGTFNDFKYILLSIRRRNEFMFVQRDVSSVQNEAIDVKFFDESIHEAGRGDCPPDYSKENFLATFAPQRNLTPEQIFWSIDDNNRKKAETLAPKPISALTVYPPNTPVKLVPRILPTKSQVKINLYVLTQLFTEFDKTCKTRITPTGITEGERGFEQTKRCYLTEVIPFFKTLKEHFVGVQTALFKEVKEMEEIFDQMNNEVDKNTVDKQCAEIEKKNLLIENENLIVNCLSTQLLYDVEKSRCLDLEADMSKVHDESKLISKLEREYLNLQLKYQHLQESFDNKNSQASQEAPDFNSFFKIKNLKHQIQEKDNVIRNLKVLVANVNDRSCEPYNAKDVTALIEQNYVMECVLLIFLNSVNATSTVKIVFNKGKQIWKPKGRLSDNSLYKTKRVWKATGKLFADIGYQWRPTGKKFALGELCPLTKLSVKWCSKHMTGNRSKLMNFVEKFIGTVRFGNDHFGAIMGYGDYVIGDSVISRVYYVEGLGHNLFSVGQFCDSDLEVAFRKHTCFVRDINGADILKGSRSTNLYTISIDEMMKSSPICLLSKASKSKSWLWHRRLNHLNFGTINDLARKDLVRGLPRLKFEKDHLCSACQLGKSKKFSHRPKSENTNMEVLHTLHMDLCGPMRVQSIKGKKYILVIVDDYSRFTWVKFLRSKNETPKFVINLLKQMQVGLNKTVRFIRTDNGTKFVNQVMSEYYEGVGIFHQKSVPRTPQQNGVVERRNCTLVEAARTMMIFSKAPMFLWAEAIATALPSATDINAQVVPPGTSLSTTIAQDAPSTVLPSSTSCTDRGPSEYSYANAATKNLIIYQMDVKTDFLNGASSRRKSLFSQIRWQNKCSTQPITRTDEKNCTSLHIKPMEGNSNLNATSALKAVMGKEFTQGIPDIFLTPKQATRQLKTQRRSKLLPHSYVDFSKGKSQFVRTGNTKKNPQKVQASQPCKKHVHPKYSHKPLHQVKQSKPAPPSDQKTSKHKLPQKDQKGSLLSKLVDEDDEHIKKGREVNVMIADYGSAISFSLDPVLSATGSGTLEELQSDPEKHMRSGGPDLMAMKKTDSGKFMCSCWTKHEHLMMDILAYSLTQWFMKTEAITDEHDQEKSKVREESDSTIPDPSHQTVTSTPLVIAPFTDVSSTKPSSLVTSPPINTEATTITTSLPEITPIHRLQLKVGKIGARDKLSEALQLGYKPGRSTKRRRSDSAASGSAQPPPKDDDQSSKKPRESDASASKQHPALTSTGWEVSDREIPGVDSSMQDLILNRTFEQSSDDIPMQMNGYDSDMGT
ncbi:retrovirus-related pol polyprotein from transposon TNT 1-94 [Tanacetum coccineum]|uniref:Retrovirus-related pol polyprotein from transposon TNT 1-94 n=1 Tax=Tanacetum coccineum TaxID=301880 RepID=A0ABQ4X713_9ASTR